MLMGYDSLVEFTVTIVLVPYLQVYSRYNPFEYRTPVDFIFGTHMYLTETAIL